uniref:Charged multivesicular body protein 1a (Trinotate prediction) n=1 Tax=Henneguya salminicola TaxID=69463 RepID=A0A6G3MIE2_HENSL
MPKADREFDEYINLKIEAKNLQREYSKSLKKSKSEHDKAKKALIKGDSVNARIFAENAIRFQTQATNLNILSSKVDAAAQGVQMAISTNKMTSSASKVVKLLSNSLSNKDLQNVKI